MRPLYVMLAAILIARGIGALAWEPLGDWQTATRVGLAVMFVFTGGAHFSPGIRGDLIRMVPPQLPNPAALVTLTGIAEIAGAVGLVTPGLARWAAYGLLMLLVAMFPANIHASRTGHSIGGQPPAPMALRLPIQLLWIALLWWAVSSPS
jgi:uncharacterized membrane protein